jgi:hypothetical protein
MVSVSLWRCTGREATTIATLPGGCPLSETVEMVEKLGRRFPEELSSGSVAELSGRFVRAERKAQIEKENAMAEVASITLKHPTVFPSTTG